MSPDSREKEVAAKMLARQVGDAMVDFRGQIERATDLAPYREVASEITRLVADAHARMQAAAGSGPEEFTVIAVPDGGAAERVARSGRDDLMEYLRAEAGEATQHFIFGPGGEVRLRSDFSVEFPDGEKRYLTPPQVATLLPDGMIPVHPALGRPRSIGPEPAPAAAAEQVGGTEREEGQDGTPAPDRPDPGPGGK